MSNDTTATRAHTSEQNEEKLTPLMRQYFDVKAQQPDCLLFFRVGDFYELFDQDALVASRELDITLTSRPESAYPGGRIPMAGVPVRSYELYIARLINKGYSVAVCEQVGVVGQSKGPVERQVSRIFTPGTILESNLLPSRQNNYLVALSGQNGHWGLAYVDASCGEFACTQIAEADLATEIARLNPAEIICAKRPVKATQALPVAHDVLDVPQAITAQWRVTGRPSMFFQNEPARRRIMEFFGVTTLDGFGLADMPLAVSAAGAIIEYLKHTQTKETPSFPGIAFYQTKTNLVLDANTRRNLELTETSRDRSFEGSLLWVLDKTCTAMGGRLLRKWLLSPLSAVPEIRNRQEAVGELIENEEARDILAKALTAVADLERLSVKIGSGSVNPKDLVAIAGSLAELPSVAGALCTAQSPYLTCLSQISPDLDQLCLQIRQALKDDPPRELTEGGIFRAGFNPELDEIRSLLAGGLSWIETFQKKEIERTGIRSLKVSYNQNFGYYIEVTHSNKDAVPQDYVRKQTLTNAERYITPELKEYEAKILNAEKNQFDLEYKLFVQFRQSLSAFANTLLAKAAEIAALDALLSLAQVAVERKYTKPVVDDSYELEIKGGRHPVLEAILPMGKYVDNDIALTASSEKNQLMILTGPNMSGKSSLLRQVAHIVLLAQMGSYVPATYAKVGIVDRIFTRIGAVDDLTQGQSTFLVEMSETTECCLAASARSLILLDEVGRGTSTYDGVAIAWSVAEYLAQKPRSRTIFATHYHELNGLSNLHSQIVNFQVLVKEADGQVEFLRKIAPGGASRSFGVQVAKMAGLPAEIIHRAEHLMNQMERRGAAAKILDGPKFRNVAQDVVAQLTLFSEVTNDFQP